jgi:mono/diheme cytochrome c family protein
MATKQVLAEARAHFADHCAICHSNNGSGNTQIGQNLYPKAPDMRLPQTQNLSDGEIYYTIHNGIRLTGMPAWGTEVKDDDSWKC